MAAHRASRRPGQVLHRFRRRPRPGAGRSLAEAHRQEVPGPRTQPVDGARRKAVPENRGLSSRAIAQRPVRRRGRLAQPVRQYSRRAHRGPRPGRRGCRSAVPEQGPDHLGHAGSPFSARPCAGSTTTGRGRRSEISMPGSRPWHASPPRTWTAPSRKSSAVRRSGSVGSHCPASRCGERPTTAT